MSGIRSLRRAKSVLGFATGQSAPIYVDSDDNLVKLIPAGSGTTETVLVDTTTSQTLTTKTLTAPTLTAPVISGAATLASGATLTTPTILIPTTVVTMTGTTGSDAATVTSVTPQYLGLTGATGSGVNLPTGPAGLSYTIGNDFAGVSRIYCVGGTINGTTGTTAFTITATGNKLAYAVNTTASGAWSIKGNT